MPEYENDIDRFDKLSDIVLTILKKFICGKKMK